jgi:hypothetical protein
MQAGSAPQRLDVVAPNINVLDWGMNAKEVVQNLYRGVGQKVICDNER